MKKDKGCKFPAAPSEDIKSRASHSSPASSSPQEDFKNRKGHDTSKAGYDAYTDGNP